MVYVWNSEDFGECINTKASRVPLGAAAPLTAPAPAAAAFVTARLQGC